MTTEKKLEILVAQMPIKALEIGVLVVVLTVLSVFISTNAKRMTRADGKGVLG